MGLRMAACPLEGGRYFILWPQEAPLRSCGAEFVIDAYSQGEVFLLDEVGFLRPCVADHREVPCEVCVQQVPAGNFLHKLDTPCCKIWVPSS
jgi:hypothetical protein